LERCDGVPPRATTTNFTKKTIKEHGKAREINRGGGRGEERKVQTEGGVTVLKRPGGVSLAGIKYTHLEKRNKVWLDSEEYQGTRKSRGGGI